MHCAPLVWMYYNNDMKLVIALGNPEQKYANTRHNVGFYALDYFAEQQGLKWQGKPKFKAETALGDRFLLAKPTTYYNLTGESTRQIADFYKLSPHDILVVHDDLALPLGTIRTRLGGSPAGNNGVKSITQHIGEDTARLRIGTHTEFPGDQTDFVLGKFTATEQQAIDAQLPKITQVIASFLAGNFEHTTHQ